MKLRGRGWARRLRPGAGPNYADQTPTEWSFVINARQDDEVSFQSPSESEPYPSRDQ